MIKKFHKCMKENVYKNTINYNLNDGIGIHVLFFYIILCDTHQKLSYHCGSYKFYITLQPVLRSNSYWPICYFVFPQHSFRQSRDSNCVLHHQEKRQLSFVHMPSTSSSYSNECLMCLWIVVFHGLTHCFVLMTC